MEIKGINVLYSFLGHKDLSMGEVFLLSLLNDIGIDKHIPSNNILAKILNTSKPNISKMISNLIKNDYLSNVDNLSDKEVFDTLSNGIHIGGCIFCGYSKSTLDEHHYPTRAKDGGTKTISICANCHREFHELADHNRHIAFTEKTKGLIDG